MSVQEYWILVAALSSMLWVLLIIHAEHAYIAKLQEALDASQAYIDEVEQQLDWCFDQHELNIRRNDRHLWPVERRPSRRGIDGNGQPTMAMVCKDGSVDRVTKADWLRLSASGMLWEIYPTASQGWEESP